MAILLRVILPFDPTAWSPKHKWPFHKRDISGEPRAVHKNATFCCCGMLGELRRGHACTAYAAAKRIAGKPPLWRRRRTATTGARRNAVCEHPAVLSYDADAASDEASDTASDTTAASAPHAMPVHTRERLPRSTRQFWRARHDPSQTRSEHMRFPRSVVAQAERQSSTPPSDVEPTLLDEVALDYTLA